VFFIFVIVCLVASYEHVGVLGLTICELCMMPTAGELCVVHCGCEDFS
jgi:hypothetical protein